VTCRLTPAWNRQSRADFPIRPGSRMSACASRSGSEEATIVQSISTKDGTRIYCKDRAERQPVMHNDHVDGDRLDVIVRP
jgi:hypothetical protein